jgi:SAM-dependent methyltransferase
MVSLNINTYNYWERRFSTGDWEAKQGREQSTSFARKLVQYLGIPASFPGTILDFGCALGDAIPVYRAAYPFASLIGMDMSPTAIEKCKENHGHIAHFFRGDYRDVPDVDVIIASNIFEHLTNDVDIALHLLTKCSDLYIMVPYKEMIWPGGEHINAYDEKSFSQLDPLRHVVLTCKGWSQRGWDLWFNVHAKNILRLLLGRPTVRPRRQILFHFVRRSHGCATEAK